MTYKVPTFCFAVLLLTHLLGACASAPENSCTVPDGVSPDWIRIIRCEGDYELLEVGREDSVFSKTTTINWLIDREDENRVYFIDSNTWLLHFHFAEAYLNVPGKTPVGSHDEFNLLNYRRDNRRFLLGKLIHYKDQGLLTLELSAGDTASIAMIVEAYTLVAQSIFDGERLRYRPVSNDQEAMLAAIEREIPVVRTNEVFAGQTYQSLNPTVGYGTLVFRRVGELFVQSVAPTDIVVLDRVPNDISLISGLITDEFQTPLSHVNILSKNRGTPNMARRQIFFDPELRALEGTLVKLEVTAQAFSVKPTTLEEAKEYWESLRPKAPLVPKSDLTVDEMVDIFEVGLSAAIAIGAKAANLGELTRIEGPAISLPESPFAIPFAYYRRHIAVNGLEDDITRLLEEYALGEMSVEALQERMFELRWQIYSSPMIPADLEEIVGELAARWSPDTRVRFRSSTNVEDLEGFSGAGLYTSTGATLSDGKNAIEDAVKVVWASAWNQQAFVERDFYRVSQDLVQMGILVHPAFENELANGVAVTINEFAKNRPAFYLNSQIGEVSVTNPTGRATPEQLLYYTWYEEPEYEVITRSSLLSTVPNWPTEHGVFTDSELVELTDQLQAIHWHFARLYPGREGFAMDVEYKLAPGRRIVIKQARPFPRR